MLFIVEVTILGLFLVDIILHSVGYGLLYLKHLVPILETLLVMINVVMLVIMEQQDSLGISRNALFGVKTIFGFSLLYLRMDTLRNQVSN